MPSLSGINVQQVCLDIFNEMKITKKDKKQSRKMAFFKINDDNTLVVPDDTILEGRETSRAPQDDRKMFNLMKNVLNQDEPRYILYDFVFDGKKGRVEKLVFIAWCSDCCNIKKRMLFASTKEALVETFKGTADALQVSDAEELSYDELTKKLDK